MSSWKRISLRRANNFGKLSAVFSCNYHLSLNDIHKRGDILKWDLGLLLDLLKPFNFNLWIDIKILKICLKDSPSLADWIYWIKYTSEYFDSYSYIEKDKAGPFPPTHSPKLCSNWVIATLLGDSKLPVPSSMFGHLLIIQLSCRCNLFSANSARNKLVKWAFGNKWDAGRGGRTHEFL